MKRILDNKYFWVDNEESFIYRYLKDRDYLEHEISEFVPLREVYDPYSTHDTAIDVRVFRSSVIEGLLK
jgi:hypothetical protein